MLSCLKSVGYLFIYLLRSEHCSKRYVFVSEICGLFIYLFIRERWFDFRSNRVYCRRAYSKSYRPIGLKFSTGLPERPVEVSMKKTDNLGASYHRNCRKLSKIDGSIE